MLKTSRVFFLFVTLLYLSSVYSANASEAGPFQGRIVNVETKQPLEGVVVLIEWRQVHFFSGSTFIDAKETLTDKDGKFYIPGIWILNPWKRLNTEAHVTIYKSGYGSTSAAMGQMAGLWDALVEIEWGAPKGTFIWKFENGNPVFMLKKLTVEERKKYSTPGWEGIPIEKAMLLIQEINKEGKFFGLGEVGPVRR